MDFFNKLSKKASEAYKVTADKTGKIAKEAKIRVKIGDLKSQIADIYKEIGEVVYQKHVREDEYDISKEVEEKCTKIDVLSDEIDSCLKECLELKDKRQCPNCYTEIEKDSKFCSKCGQKQKENDNKAIEVQIENNNNENNNNENNNDENNENKNNDCNEEKEISNLEKTVAVESDVDENHDETVEYLEVEED